jgi:hypothetical protein
MVKKYKSLIYVFVCGLIVVFFCETVAFLTDSTNPNVTDYIWNGILVLLLIFMFAVIYSIVMFFIVGKIKSNELKKKVCEIPGPL